MTYIYTDASVNIHSLSASWGYILLSEKMTIREASINFKSRGLILDHLVLKMEAKAIKEALKNILPHEKAIVYSDAKWCLQGKRRLKTLDYHPYVVTGKIWMYPDKFNRFPYHEEVHNLVKSVNKCQTTFFQVTVYQ